MSTIEHDSATLTLRTSQVRICSVGGNESLGLRRDWGEHAFLIETNAVDAATILRGFKARASDLLRQLAMLNQDRVHIYIYISYGSDGRKLQAHTFRLRQYRQAIAVRCRGAAAW